MANDLPEDPTFDCQKQIEEVDNRSRRAFRMAMTFIRRLLKDNELFEQKFRHLENEIADLKEIVSNLTKMGEN